MEKISLALQRVLASQTAEDGEFISMQDRLPAQGGPARVPRDSPPAGDPAIEQAGVLTGGEHPAGATALERFTLHRRYSNGTVSHP